MSEEKMSDKKQTTGRVRSSTVRRRRQSLRARRRRRVWMIRGILLLVALGGLSLAVWGISAAIREGSRLKAGASSASGEESQEDLVAMGADSVRHFSFPILLVEDQAAGEGSSPLTLEEFQQILQDLYDKDYLLVDIYDLAAVSTLESGSQVYEKGRLSLPEGKKPFVLSQRDVSYPFDKAGNGYAS